MESLYRIFARRVEGRPAIDLVVSDSSVTSSEIQQSPIVETLVPPSMRDHRSRRRITRGHSAVFALLIGAGMGAVSPAESTVDPIRLDPIVVVAPAPTQEPADDMRLVVNLPAFRLEVFVGEELVRTFPVTIGAHGYETPTGSYTIADIIFNPWWHPPQSDWAVGKSPVAPGVNNPMGRAKLNFGPLLYVHGSSNLEALGNVGSHGCVRLGNDDILELAQLVQDFGAPETDELVEGLIGNPGRTQKIDLARSVSLEIRYDVVEVRNGELTLYPDVYGLRKNLVAADVVSELIRAGVDLGALDSPRIAEWIAESNREVRQIAIDDLLGSPFLASVNGGAESDA